MKAKKKTFEIEEPEEFFKPTEEKKISQEEIKEPTPEQKVKEPKVNPSKVREEVVVNPAKRDINRGGRGIGLR